MVSFRSRCGADWQSLSAGLRHGDQGVAELLSEQQWSEYERLGYMDGRTRNTLTGDRFPIVIGEPGAAWPFLQSVREENRSLRESAAEAERYAMSLAEHAGRLEQMRSETEQYAKALEVELSGVRAAAPPGDTQP
ncbi:MAG: hypothetical protein ABI818_00620 [Acidobacteriota bacterium]